MHVTLRQLRQLFQLGVKVHQLLVGIEEVGQQQLLNEHLLSIEDVELTSLVGLRNVHLAGIETATKKDPAVLVQQLLNKQHDLLEFEAPPWVVGAVIKVDQ